MNCLDSHGEDVIEKLAVLDGESTSTVLPHDVETVKRLSGRLDELRRSALESMRMALQVKISILNSQFQITTEEQLDVCEQDGEVLIHNLTALKNQGTLDSRPGHILPAINTGNSQLI